MRSWVDERAEPRSSERRERRIVRSSLSHALARASLAACPGSSTEQNHVNQASLSRSLELSVPLGPKSKASSRTSPVQGRMYTVAVRVPVCSRPVSLIPSSCVKCRSRRLGTREPAHLELLDLPQGPIRDGRGDARGGACLHRRARRERDRERPRLDQLVRSTFPSRETRTILESARDAHGQPQAAARKMGVQRAAA